MMKSVRIDAAVVGGGVIGLTAAIELARRGREVHLLEAGEIAGGASAHNAGQIRPAACVPLAKGGAIREALRAGSFQRGRPIRLGAKAFSNWRWMTAFASWSHDSDIEPRTQALAHLGKASEAAFAALEAQTGARLLERRGALDVYESDDTWTAAAEAVPRLSELGFAAEAVSVAQVREHAPALEGQAAGGVLFPEAAHCDPAALLRALRQLAGKLGVQLHPRTQVARVWQGRDSGLLEVDGGRVEAELAVVAAGDRSRHLFPGPEARVIPIIPGRGYGVDLESEADLKVPLILAERHLAITPLGSDLIRLTSGMELGVTRQAVSRGRRRALLRASALIPSLQSHAVIAAWSARRPMTPDGLPIIGFMPGRSRVLVASGHGMLGVTHGPGTGRLVADLVGGERPAWARAFDPMRFSRGWKPQFAR